MLKHRLSLLVVTLAALLLPTLTIAQENTRNPEAYFSLAVVPDTQYLFDQDRGDSAPLEATFQWIIDHQDEYNIAFVAQLGDIVENALPEEFAQADAVFDLLDEAEVPYSYLAGNHDHTSSGEYDNERDITAPYWEHFSPERVEDNATFGGATENGLNMYFTFEAGGMDWLLFALDWQVSQESLAWAQSVIDEHPTLPVIVTTHQLVDDDGSDAGQAYLTDYGQYLWDELISSNDAIFLTLNGHYWPPARTTMQNDAGNDVSLQLTNYQDRYYGGAGMMRLYQFDMERGTIEVSTFSPYFMAQSADERTALAEELVELYDPTNRFVMEIDFAERFADFSVTAQAEAQALAVEEVVIDGTMAYWRFEGAAGEPLPTEGIAVADLSGNGNDLYRETLTNGDMDDLTYTAAYDPAQPSRGSLYLNGSYRNPSFGGAYLRTGDDAALNTMTFEDGYTVEAFVRLPADCCGSQHAWMGVLSRMGVGADIGQTEGDLDEPVVQLGISPGRQVQWATRTTNQQNILTNWSHEVEADVWHHIALVNDGEQTVMYIDGALNLRNPRAESIGLATNNQYWTIGAGHYANLVEQSFYGWLGDIRIVNHALTPDEFMIAR